MGVYHIPPVVADIAVVRSLAREDRCVVQHPPLDVTHSPHITDGADLEGSRKVLSRTFAWLLIDPESKTSPAAKKFCTSLISLLLEELQSLPEREERADIIIAAYLVFIRAFGLEGSS